MSCLDLYAFIITIKIKEESILYVVQDSGVSDFVCFPNAVSIQLLVYLRVYYFQQV